MGLEPTLSALVEDKVWTLLIANGLTVEGCVCTRCDYFSKEISKICPFCGADAQHTDFTDRAVEKAILTGAEAEVVSSTEARDRLVAEGRFGSALEILFKRKAQRATRKGLRSLRHALCA